MTTTQPLRQPHWGTDHGTQRNIRCFSGRPLRPAESHSGSLRVLRRSVLVDRDGRLPDGRRAGERSSRIAHLRSRPRGGNRRHIPPGAAAPCQFPLRGIGWLEGPPASKRSQTGPPGNSRIPRHRRIHDGPALVDRHCSLRGRRGRSQRHCRADCLPRRPSPRERRNLPGGAPSAGRVATAQPRTPGRPAGWRRPAILLWPGPGRRRRAGRGSSRRPS